MSKYNRYIDKKKFEKPLTEQIKRDIIGAYRRGKSIDDIAGYVNINPYRVLAVVIDDELAAIEEKE